MKESTKAFYEAGAKRDLFKVWAMVNMEFSRAVMCALETEKSFRAVLEYDAEAVNVEMKFFNTDHPQSPYGDRSIQEC